MINSVRNTVLAVLNKNNYGYLSPGDFNLFAKQAQLEIFTGYFEQYNDRINRENNRLSGTDYADIRRNIEENLEVFFQVDNLPHVEDNIFELPTTANLGYDYFFLNKLLCYTPIDGGRTLQGEAEKVSNGKINMLINSSLTAPTNKFPAYVIQGNIVKVYPDTFNADNSVECYYFRYPKDPKWTYRVFGNGEPIFDPSQNDYQDFEVRPEDEVNLIIKILQYAGISIRETEVYQFAKVEEQGNDQDQIK